ncbi:MAG TPA: hypothetical protein VKR80_07425 [Candidatus Limnocylindria bacterium]|nr:hypothetical protein [Candidatus Limnocylindria bacterium]
MPQPATPNMALVLPTPTGDIGMWGDELNAALTLVDVHDHTTGKGVAITPSGLNINAPLGFQTQSAQHLGSVDFDEVPALSAGARRLFFNSSDHEWYVRTAAGANVKITNGPALNVAAFVGGIGGDYSSAGALLSYDDATRRYLLQQEGAPRPWAGLATADIDLYQKAASIVNRITLKSPNALAASYVLTLLTALPSGLLPLQVDNTGQIVTNRVLVAAPGFTTAATMILPVAGAEIYSGVKDAGTTGTANTLTTVASSQRVCIFPIHLRSNDTITSFNVSVNKTTNASTTISARLFHVGMTTGTEGADGSGASNSANAPGIVFISEGSLAAAITPNLMYYIAVVTNGVGSGDLILGATVSFTRS